ncbi:UNVERIFIED_CONTAM: hypothetical protein RMT77_013398 [Armadillidium vulgare]
MGLLSILIVCVTIVSVYSEEFSCNSTTVNYKKNCKASKILTIQHCYLDADFSKEGKLFISNEGEVEDCMLKISGMKKENKPYFETEIYSTKFQTGDWNELSWTVTIRKPHFDYIYFYLNKEKVGIEYPYSWTYIRVYVQGNLLVAKDDCVLQINKENNKVDTTTPLPSITLTTNSSSENHVEKITSTERSKPEPNNQNHTKEALNEYHSNSDYHHHIFMEVTFLVYFLQNIFFI